MTKQLQYTTIIHPDRIDYDTEIINNNFKVYVVMGTGDIETTIDINEYVEWLCLQSEIDEFKYMGDDCETGEVKINHNGGYFDQYTNTFTDCQEISVHTFDELHKVDLITNELIAKYLTNNSKYEF